MLSRRLFRLICDERAQDLIEYALLLACVALGVVVGLQSLGTAVTGSYGDATTVIATGARGGGNPGNATPGAGTPGQGNPGGGNPGKGNGNGGGSHDGRTRAGHKLFTLIASLLSTGQLRPKPDRRQRVEQRTPAGGGRRAEDVQRASSV